MVYRGKPSAGCDPCRKAKKRCTLEVPACARCVKLKKDCSGYRDTSALQIQDESEAVKRKAIKQKVRQDQQRQCQPLETTSKLELQARPDVAMTGILSPETTRSESSAGSSDDNVELLMASREMTRDVVAWKSLALVENKKFEFSFGSTGTSIPISLAPRVDDVAATHFYKQFTSDGHWNFLHGYNRQPHLDPCLDLAVRACGMAALNNVEHVQRGKDYARGFYVEALGLLNAALRDPQRCITDESLIAVAMLGYYENLTCDSRQSIQSWKAHISGATQLLKLRGPAQFRTATGRM